MKILIIGFLGAGKSTLAYEINKRFHLPRLNLDELHRNPKTGEYRSQCDSTTQLEKFLNTHSGWVIEGCQKYLYEKTNPDFIIDMRINRLIAIWRFTIRFIKAKKLIGKQIDKDLPVQAYHYRKITLSKIIEWDQANKKINTEMEKYLKTTSAKVIKCYGKKEYKTIFREIKQSLQNKHKMV